MLRRERLLSLFVGLLVFMSRVHGAKAQDIDAILGAHPYGGALSAYAGAGGEESVPGSEFAKRGFHVKIKKLTGTADEAFDELLRKKLDLLVLSTDLAARLAAEDKTGAVKTFLLISYSQGSLGLIGHDRFQTVRDLASARIAVPALSPSQFYLTKVLRSFGVALNDVHIEPTQTTAQADELLRTGKVDAAVLWTPYLTRAQKRPQMRIIRSTEEGNQLISSILVARTEWLDQHAARIPEFITAWMAGVQRTQSDVAESTRVIAQATGLSDTEVYETLSRTKMTRLEENAEFMGLRGKAPLSRYERDVKDALGVWHELKAIPPGNAAVRPALRSEYVAALVPKGAPPPDPAARPYGGAHTDALAKNVYFAKSKVTLDAKAKDIIQSFVNDEAYSYANSRIRIEGNADAPKDGTKLTPWLQQVNLKLSMDRAMAVATELIALGIAPERLVVVGNGARLNDQVDKNRRTELFFE